MKFSFSDCGGCRSCELACSYHLSGGFDIAKAAIEITEKEGGGYEVTLLERAAGARLPCDGCRGLDIPFCERYCHSFEILKEYVDVMRERVNGKVCGEHE